MLRRHDGIRRQKEQLIVSQRWAGGYQAVADGSPGAVDDPQHADFVTEIDGTNYSARGCPVTDARVTEKPHVPWRRSERQQRVQRLRASGHRQS
jgi:hypothetical protein